MTKSFFITGTGTDVGKTYFATQLIKAYRKRNVLVSGFKPVASGGQWKNGQLVNQDALDLMGEACELVPYKTVNPYCFEPAIAPHIAANQAGVEIELSIIKTAFYQHTSASDVVIIEGAGGWKVPLSDKLGFDDLVLDLRSPVILVVGLTLGCINNALLTEEAILNKGCRLAGWVANAVDPEFKEVYENIEALKARLKSPYLSFFDNAVIKGNGSNFEHVNIESLLDYLIIFR